MFGKRTNAIPQNIPYNIQPITARYRHGDIALAHNGNLTNQLELRNRLVDEGAIFRSSSDSETLVHLIAKSRADTIDAQVLDALGIARAAFWGMSGGGYLTLRCAATIPERIRRAVLIVPAGLVSRGIINTRVFGWVRLSFMKSSCRTASEYIARCCFHVLRGAEETRRRGQEVHGRKGEKVQRERGQGRKGEQRVAQPHRFLDSAVTDGLRPS